VPRLIESARRGATTRRKRRVYCRLVMSQCRASMGSPGIAVKVLIAKVIRTMPANTVKQLSQSCHICFHLEMPRVLKYSRIPCDDQRSPIVAPWKRSQPMAEVHRSIHAIWARAGCRSEGLLSHGVM
jgi:hypothetical protein